MPEAMAETDGGESIPIKISPISKKDYSELDIKIFQNSSVNSAKF